MRGATARLGGFAVVLLAACGPALPPATEQGLPLSACPSGALGGPYLRQIPGNGSHDRLLLERAVLHQVNKARCDRGIGPLSPDRSLTAAAQVHVQDMTRLGIFAHELPVTGRETVTRRLNTLGVRFRRAAENIADGYYLSYTPGRGYREVDTVRCSFEYADGTPITRQTYASLAGELVKRWTDSPPHRQNILNQGMRRHGFAIAPVGDLPLCGRLYASQVLAG